MKESSGPYYVYANGNNSDSQLVPARRSVLVRSTPPQEIRESRPIEYWRPSSRIRSSRSRTPANDSSHQIVQRVVMPRDSVYMSDLVPVVRQKHVYSEPPRSRRTRYLSESSKHSNSRVHVYDVHNQSPISFITRAVPRQEYIPIGSRTRSISTPRVSDVPIRTNGFQTTQSTLPPRPGEIYTFIDHNNPSRYSLPIITDFDPAVVKLQPVVRSQPKESRSSWLTTYHLDPTQKMRSQSIPNLRASSRPRKNNPITIIETEPKVNEVIISRNPAPKAISSTIYTPQARSASIVPIEGSKRSDPPYPIISIHEPRVGVSRERPYPREISTCFPTKYNTEKSISVPPRTQSDASVITVNQFNPVSRSALHNSNVFYSPEDTTYIAESSYPVVSKVTRQNIHNKTEYEIPLPSVITVWSENGSRRPYNAENVHLINEQKQSKISQMGPPMLFSDLETDSDSSEAITRIYQVVAPEPMVKTTHPNSRNAFKPSIKENYINSCEPLQEIQPNDAVTLLNPNDPDGPKVTDQGPVFLYANRLRHNTRNSGYSE